MRDEIASKPGPKGPRTDAGYMTERKVNMDDATWKHCLQQPEGASKYLRNLVHLDQSKGPKLFMRTKRMSASEASKALSSGNFVGFVNALDLYVDQYVAEFGRRQSGQTEEQYQGDLAEIGQARSEASQAGAIYTEEMEKARVAAVESLRNAGLDDFAEALETGDYSRLAI